MSLSTNKITDDAIFEERRLEVENRIRNLMWTVSGDYELDTKLDIDSFRKSRYISLYDAAKQGGFAKNFNVSELALYIVKKCFLGAEQPNVIKLAQIAIDLASHKKVEAERAGIADLRKRAFSDSLEHSDFKTMTESLVGMLQLTMIQKTLDPEYRTTKKLEDAWRKLEALEDATETMDVIRVIDELYNELLDQTFERKQGKLEDVLEVTLEELAEYGWKDFLNDTAIEENFDDFMNRVSREMMKTQLPQEEEEEEKKKGPQKKHVVKITEEDLQKIYSYVELNFGTSYLSQREQRKLEYELCRGAHADCSLYYTEGIIGNVVRNNYQYQYALRQLSVNKNYLKSHLNIARKNISDLSEILEQALIRRRETETIHDDHGVIIPSKLWKVGRTNDRRLFDRDLKRNSTDFVVDILIDASGSQKVRAPKVALQGYIISCALSKVGIPHRVMSFCTFWDYTILHRFRDYDDTQVADRNIMEYSTSSNNRDGLAIRAASYGLLKREEENKILIVLSDGKPNDVVVNRPNSKNPKPYEGAYAIKDTAMEVRHSRNLGISVLGVFAGKEEELQAEKKIFGRDFAYIRDITKFSNVVGAYLKRQLDEED